MKMYEEKYESNLRKVKVAIPIISLIILGFFFYVIYQCLEAFNQGEYWTIFPAAFLTHAVLIIGVHDAVHRNIFQNSLDDVLMTLVGGLALLPFIPELHRKYHLIHHGNTNEEHDPLWSPIKNKLYNKSRLLYIISQLIPLVFTAFVLLNSEKKKKEQKPNMRAPKIRLHYMLISFIIAGTVIYLIPFNIYFFLLNLLFLSVLSSIRHWCEHMGTESNVESNTFWFPLGMGIGNHHIHHINPNISWIALYLGQFRRRKNTSVLRVLWHILTNPKFKHYRSEQTHK